METTLLVNKQFLVLPPIGHVYACKSEESPNRIKIGFCNNVEECISSLNAGRDSVSYVLVTSAASFDNVRDERMASIFFAGAKREDGSFEISEETVKAYFQMHIVAEHQQALTSLVYQSQSQHRSHVSLTPDKERILSSFLSALIHKYEFTRDTTIDFIEDELFSQYSKFCANKHGKHVELYAFRIILPHISGITKRNVNRESVFTICFCKLLSSLALRGQYDKKAQLDP